MSLKKTIILNAGSNWASMVVISIVGVVLVPVMLRTLGKTGYGVWALLAYGLNFPMVLDSAFTTAINRFVAYHKGNKQEVCCFISASFLIMMTASILIIAVSTGLSFFVTDIFSSIPDSYSFQAQTTCILVGLTLAIKVLQSTYSGALLGYMYYTRYNLVNIFSNLLRLVLTIVLLSIWRSVIVVQLAFVVASIISSLSMFIVARRSIVGLKTDLRLVNKQKIKELFQFTGHIGLREGSRILMQNILMLLVGWKGTAEHVTVYSIGTRLPNLIRGFIRGAQGIFLPAISNFYASGKTEAIKSIVKKATRLNFVLTAWSMILLFIFCGDILCFWLRGDTPDGVVIVMRLMIISLVPAGIFEVWIPVLVGLGHLRGLTIATVSSAIAAILLEWIFLNNFDAISIPMAPALALAVIMWIRAGFWLPVYGLKKLNMNIFDYIKITLFTPLVAGLVSILVFWGLSQLSAFEELFWFLRLIGLIIIISIIFVLFSLRGEAVELAGFLKKRIRAN